MIRDLLHLLASVDYLDTNDEDIQFAKGAYEFPLSFKELRQKQKRRKLIRNGRR